MTILNFFLWIVCHIIPVRLLDYLSNYSLPKSRSSFITFSRIHPSLFEYISSRKMLYMFKRAAKLVPAYRNFLIQSGIDPLTIKNMADFRLKIPHTSKKNYVQCFSLKDRCYYGRFPSMGMLEESSGTTCASTTWLKSKAEEENQMAITATSMRFLYGFENRDQYIVINGLMLGGWSGGIRFASRFENLGIVKNIGPDPRKIIQCLKELGPEFTYLIGGYPPFIVEMIEFGKRLTDFDWSEFKIHILACGEGFTEGWRDYVASQLKPGALIYSDYGAIDLDVGISVETPFSVIIKKLVTKDPVLRNHLFSSERIPCFIGQYSPLQFNICESVNENAVKELEITVLNLKTIAPNIKYAIGDEGGILRFQDICEALERQGYSITKMNLPAIIPFPFLYVYGRSDGTVTVNGALISPSEIQEALLADPELVKAIHTFRLSVESDPENNIRLFIFVELRKDEQITEELSARCNHEIIKGLLSSNECFRINYEKNQASTKPIVSLVPYHTGIFMKNTERIKQNYLKQVNNE